MTRAPRSAGQRRIAVTAVVAAALTLAAFVVMVNVAY